MKSWEMWLMYFNFTWREAGLSKTLYNPKGFHPQLLNSIRKRWDVGAVKSITTNIDALLWQFCYRNKELVCLKIIILSSLEIVLLYWDNIMWTMAVGLLLSCSSCNLYLTDKQRLSRAEVQVFTSASCKPTR